MSVVPIVYIVDDDEAVRESLRLLLEISGRQVRNCSSGGEFLAALPAAPGGCAIIDYHMPVMNGLEVVEALRSRRIPIPAIVITGLSDQAMRRRAEAAGVLALFEKPFDQDALLETVDRALDHATVPRAEGSGERAEQR